VVRNVEILKQISLAKTGYEPIVKKTRKRVFLGEMELVTLCRELVGLIQPFRPDANAKSGRPSFRVKTMLRMELELTRFDGHQYALHPSKAASIEY